MTTAEFLKARYGQPKKFDNPCGISLFIDRKKNIVMTIYHAHAEYGFGIDIGDYIELPYPYTLEEVGSRVLEGYRTRVDMPLVTNEVRDSSKATYEILTNGKGFLHWLRRHECIEVRIQKDQIIVEYEHRADTGDDRGYSRHREEYNETEIILPPDASPSELGAAINQVYFTRNEFGLVS